MEVLGYTKLVHVWHYLLSTCGGDDRSAAFSAAEIITKVKDGLLIHQTVTADVIAFAHGEAQDKF